MNKKQYFHSTLGISLETTEILIVIFIITSILIFGKLFPTVIVIPFFFIFPFIVSSIWNRKKSMFEIKNDLIAKYNGVFMNDSKHPLLPAYTPIYKILIYKKGIEIRVLFSSLFIPYEKVLKIENKRATTWGQQIIIYSNVDYISQRIALEGLKENVYTIVEKSRKEFININRKKRK